jgi:uncharacterized protein YcsI (UPF0317 family)
MTTAMAPASDPTVAREHFRAGLAVPSSGWAPGFTQTNLVVLPREWAYDMALFAQRNPQPDDDTASPARKRSRAEAGSLTGAAAVVMATILAPPLEGLSSDS